MNKTIDSISYHAFGILLLCGIVIFLVVYSKNQPHEELKQTEMDVQVWCPNNQNIDLEVKVKALFNVIRNQK